MHQTGFFQMEHARASPKLGLCACPSMTQHHPPCSAAEGSPWMLLERSHGVIQPKPSLDLAASNLPSEGLFWIGTFCLPQGGRGLSYFIAKTCYLILCCYYRCEFSTLTFCNVTYVSVHVEYLFPSTLNLNEKIFVSLIFKSQE